ncbi:hypothetical protein LU604_07745 [Erwinia tracheiphila]|uniref:Prophage protein n=1 Tax=Erwinia tracheiphila TaxID=65700 RepID=A0A345CSW5_9GAMM|nr:hypothetical protein [Erwinia tracheiphila]AXF76532.1 hypothetical protein AV903_11555 [Erwinia tracheiphila]UIA84799.1 hypothetical protein LU604_07745 [Erwinia tracheiphila]UIA93394.1 hypothetical protein LU632_07705 [Erwinia tracheiphila]
MKSITDINQQLVSLQSAIAVLKAMHATVQSVMILGAMPVIRIARNGQCVRMIEQGKASYSYIGHNGTGRFRQGTFPLYGCRVFWSESLIN